LRSDAPAPAIGCVTEPRVFSGLRFGTPKGVAKSTRN
jgi:hypothetical protein